MNPAPWSTVFVELLRGLGVVFQIAAGAWLLGAVLGFVLALLDRANLKWATRLQEFLSASLRSLPELLVIYLVFYGFSSSLGLSLGPLQSVMIGLGIVYSGFMCEFYRASFFAIPIRQRDAGVSLGMGAVDLMRYIYVPHIVRFMIPPWTNMFVGLLKMGTLASAVGVAEIVYQGQQFMNQGNDVLLVALMMAGVYLMVSIPLAALFRVIEWRVRGRSDVEYIAVP